MSTTKSQQITVSTKVNAPIEKVWAAWTTPEYIMKWNQASEDWHTVNASNDLKEGGRFSYRMEAKDKSFGFDFAGIYDEVKPNELITYTMEDGRKTTVKFTNEGTTTGIEETFDAEGLHDVEMQRNGWQAILDSFKKYVEAQ